MKPTDEELFRCMTIGLLFRTAFQSLLTTMARQQGEAGLNWLNGFEARVREDVQRLTVDKTLPERIVEETIKGAVDEFADVFGNARKQIAQPSATDGADRKQVSRQRSSRSPASRRTGGRSR